MTVYAKPAFSTKSVVLFNQYLNIWGELGAGEWVGNYLEVEIRTVSILVMVQIEKETCCWTVETSSLCV